MDTAKFRTRQEIVAKESPKGSSYIIALDAGYSSMKVFTENKYFCFPSYAKKIDDNMLPISSAKDIKYRDDETGEIYMLGYSAQDMIASTDTNDTDGEMFTRKRWNNKKVHILCRAAIGIALIEKTDARDIVIQTGLPTSYVIGDAGAQKKALCQPAKFSIKLGGGEWRSFDLAINPDNVFTMPQPAGALYSVMIDKDGKYVPNAKDYMFNNVLVLDNGFGTFDFYGIMSREKVCQESIDEIGMRKVLQKTSEKIMNEYDEDIRVQALQKNLEQGYVTCINEDDLSAEDKPIDVLLEKANREVFDEAFSRAKAITSSFRGYKYVIIAGGTGEAWFPFFEEELSGMKSLSIIPSNINDDLSFIYSNVRGYYMYCYTLHK